MMYDFYEIPLKLKHATHHNPLYSASSNNNLTHQAISNSIDFWLRSSMQRGKIVVGVELYARTYRLFRNGQFTSSLGSTVNREGAPGIYTQINGTLAYFETCDMLTNNEPWVYNWIEVEKVPYMYNRQESIGFFEDPDSVEAKANYVRLNGLGGIGLFSLDQDDFTGLFCNLGAFPLVQTVKDVFNVEMHQKSTIF